MIYQEKVKDLFKMKNVDAVAHCIAQDAHMGAVIANNYKTIAMPMIGAGLDRLNWKTQVLPTIRETFNDLDVEITVCFLDANAKYMGA